MRTGSILLFLLFLLAPSFATARHAEETLTPPVGVHPLPFAADATVLASTLGETVLEISIDVENPGLLSESHSAGVGLVAVAHRGQIKASILEVEASNVTSFDQTIAVPSAEVPQTVVQLGRPAIWRDLRVVTLRIAPCWDFATTTLIARRLLVRIESIGGLGINEKTRSVRSVSPMWDNLYRRHVLNYDSMDLPKGERGTGKRYLVISRDRFNSQTPQFVTWKTRQGYRVDIVTLEDLGYTDPTPTACLNATRNYIQNAYNTWPETPEFVLLVGDILGSIPDGSIYTETFYNMLWWEGTRYYDQWYALLEGSDLLPDIMLGRFPDVNTTRLDYELAKTIEYEKYPNIDGTWQKNALMTAKHQYEPNGPTMQTKAYVSDILSGWGMDVTERFQSQATPSQILPVVNQGLTFYNYRGYYCGSTNWYDTFRSSDVQYLTNTDKLGVWTILSCSSAHFDGSSAITAELLLRHDYTNPASPKGAVAFIGSQAYTWYLYNNALDKGIYQAFTNNGASILGDAFVSGKLFAYNTTSHSDTQAVMMREYTILGDPSLQVWTDVPTAMTVTTDPTTIPVGPSTNVDISVTTATRAPIPGALVCLWKGTEVYIYGYTNTAGSITLPVQPTTEGTVKLTVTAYNHVPHLSDIPAASGSGIPQAPVIDAQAIGNHLRLTWAPVTQDLEGAPITVDHYNVYRNTVAHYSVSGASFLGSTDSSPYDDYNVVGNPSVNYFYRIVAVSTGGQASPPSDAVGEFDCAAGE
jgi:hypothetical protein